MTGVTLFNPDKFNSATNSLIGDQNKTDYHQWLIPVKEGQGAIQRFVSTSAGSVTHAAFYMKANPGVSASNGLTIFSVAVVPTADELAYLDTDPTASTFKPNSAVLGGGAAVDVGFGTALQIVRGEVIDQIILDDSGDYIDLQFDMSTPSLAGKEIRGVYLVIEGDNSRGGLAVYDIYHRVGGVNYVFQLASSTGFRNDTIEGKFTIPSCVPIADTAQSTIQNVWIPWSTSSILNWDTTYTLRIQRNASVPRSYRVRLSDVLLQVWTVPEKRVAGALIGSRDGSGTRLSTEAYGGWLEVPLTSTWSKPATGSFSLILQQVDVRNGNGAGPFTQGDSMIIAGKRELPVTGFVSNATYPNNDEWYSGGLDPEKASSILVSPKLKRPRATYPTYDTGLVDDTNRPFYVPFYFKRTSTLDPDSIPNPFHYFVMIGSQTNIRSIVGANPTGNTSPLVQKFQTPASAITYRFLIGSFVLDTEHPLLHSRTLTVSITPAGGGTAIGNTVVLNAQDIIDNGEFTGTIYSSRYRRYRLIIDMGTVALAASTNYDVRFVSTDAVMGITYTATGTRPVSGDLGELNVLGSTYGITAADNTYLPGRVSDDTAVWQGFLATAPVTPSTATATNVTSSLSVNPSGIAETNPDGSACFSAGLPSVQLSWTGTVDASFSYWEIQRADNISSVWSTVATISASGTLTFVDKEARVGFESCYRVRQVATTGAVSGWKDSNCITCALPAGTNSAFMMFTSNQSPTDVWGFTDVYDDGIVQQEYGFPESEEVTYKNVYGRDYTVEQRPPEERGVIFTRTVLTDGLATPTPITGPPAWEQFRTFIRNPETQYVCVRDHFGNRWFASVVIPTGSVASPGDGNLHYLTVQVREITDSPAPYEV